jgi:hypothetical protein
MKKRIIVAVAVGIAAATMPVVPPTCRRNMVHE